MNYLTQILIAGFVALVAGLAVGSQIDVQMPPINIPESLGSRNPDFGNCTVSENMVSVNPTTATTILQKDATRQWAIIQQIRNATNTISLSFAGSAVAGRGYELISTTTQTLPEIVFGPQGGVNTINAVTGIASSGTTSIKVIECKGNSY